MIVSTHGILASSGARDIASGYLFKSTTDTTTVTGVTTNTISYSNLIPANTMLVGDFFQYQLNAVRSGANGSVAVRIYFNTSASLVGATLAGSVTVAPTNNMFMSRIAMIKSATNTEFNIVSGSITVRDVQLNTVPVVANINWTVNQYFIIAFQPTSALDSFYVNGLFFLKT
tara:strand:+ start:313 stop:828 length:516 start_codon:yes stop_codon:yes gene_type:complete